MTDRTTLADAAALREKFDPQLTPCPFCAGWGFPIDGRSIRGQDRPVVLPVPDQEKWMVRCWACGTSQWPQRTPEEAVRRWNVRATQSNPPEAFLPPEPGDSSCT